MTGDTIEDGGDTSKHEDHANRGGNKHEDGQPSKD